MGPLKRFFLLTSSFFGLTSDYKVPLLDEIYLCIKHLKIPYTDVLAIPVYERRYYLTKLIDENNKKKEQIENQQQNTKNGKGKRTTTISGAQLKSRLKSGQIPNQ